MSKWHWSVWVRGLFSALISGAGTGVVAALAVPNEVQTVHPYLVAKIAAGGAIIGVANYLKQSPLPQADP